MSKKEKETHRHRKRVVIAGRRLVGGGGRGIGEIIKIE